MKRNLLFIILLVAVALALPAVVPVSEHVGELAIMPEEGSITKIALESVMNPLTPEWFERYTDGSKAMIDYWSDELLSILPLQNVIAGEEKNNAVSLYDLDKKVMITFSFNDEKRISALEIR